MPLLTLIRGLPGSGKSTLARQLCAENPHMVHLEADMYFISLDGQYHFDARLLPAAHSWCQQQTLRALSEGHDVVVSNTFIERWELTPYQRLAKLQGNPCRVLVCRGEYESIHQVPKATIEKMKRRWQP